MLDLTGFANALEKRRVEIRRRRQRLARAFIATTLVTMIALAALSAASVLASPFALI